MGNEQSLKGEDEVYNEIFDNENEVIFVKNYVLCNLSNPPKLIQDVEKTMHIGKSKIKTTYVVGYDEGLIASRNIEKGEAVIPVNHEWHQRMNDAMMDLTDIIEAKTSVEMENALIKTRSKYYDLEQGEKLVNVVMGVCQSHPTNIMYVTTRFIAKGEELKRAYGFSTWLKEVAELNILTIKTLPGYLNYVKSQSSMIGRNPFGYYIKIVMENFQNIVETCYGESAWKFGELMLSDDFDGWIDLYEEEDQTVQFKYLCHPMTKMFPENFPPKFEIAMGENKCIMRPMAEQFGE